MAKFSKRARLGKAQAEEFIINFCKAVAVIKNPSEAAKLLTDLLGRQEMEMLAKRLKIAEMLIDDSTYRQIGQALKVSSTTVARVQTWLQASGEGDRLAVERIRKTGASKSSKNMNFNSLKKRYPIYFWPQILLENWVKKSNDREKRQMRVILDKLQSKAGAYKELSLLLANQRAKNKDN